MMSDKNNQQQNSQQQGTIVTDPIKAMQLLGYSSVDVGGATIDLTQFNQQQSIGAGVDNGHGGDVNHPDQSVNQQNGGDPANPSAGNSQQQGSSGQSGEQANTDTSPNDNNTSSDQQDSFFSDDSWKQFLPEGVESIDQMISSQSQSSQNSQPNTDSQSSFVDQNNKTITVLDVAKEMGVDYDPSEALNPESDSHKVYAEFQKRLLQAAVLQAQQLQNRQLQQQQQQELVKQKIKKLVEVYPDMRSPDGGVDQKKLLAMVNYVKSLESSDEGLVILREFVDFIRSKRLGAVARQQNQNKNKNNSQQQQMDVNQQQSQQQFVFSTKAKNGVEYQATVDSDTLNEFKRLFGG